MKTYKQLFEKLCSWQNLESAYWKAGKQHETPLPVKGIPKSAFKDFKPTKQMILHDISDLRKRWKKEGKTGGRTKINAPDGI